jgi:uncharacterized protein YndB with AHSA1/START domain
MTDKDSNGNRILGTLAAADGRGVVRMEDRYDTSIDDLWSALTDPARLARWLGEIDGDLRVGGVYRARYYASGWEGTVKIEVCEPPRRFRLAAAGDSPNPSVTEVTLTTDGDQTIFVLEQRGMPLEMIAGFGAGIQVHVEDLAAHIAGRERCDSDARMNELYPDYSTLQISAG